MQIKGTPNLQSVIMGYGNIPPEQSFLNMQLRAQHLANLQQIAASFIASLTLEYNFEGTFPPNVQHPPMPPNLFTPEPPKPDQGT